jgi:tripartite-type tricarboxylate transporter receptor subunit TctC
LNGNKPFYECIANVYRAALFLPFQTIAECRTMHAKLLRALIVFAVLVSSGPIQAQAPSYPTGPIRIVVATTAGGPADLVARTLGTKLAELLGATVLVENKAGANGNIAADFVAKSAPDGHTLLLGTGAFAINPAIYKKLNYNGAKDFAPVAMALAPGPFVLVTHPSVPAKTVAELIKYGNAQSVALTYASAGIGNSTHLAGEMFSQLGSVSLRHVPYRGMSVGLNDVLAGQVQMMFNAWPSVENFVAQGKLRVLAQTGAHRQAPLGDIPTMGEAGVAGFEFTGWMVLFARAGTPTDTLNKLNAAVRKAVDMPDVRAKFAAFGGADPSTLNPAQVSSFVQAEVLRMDQVAKAAKLSLESD